MFKLGVNYGYYHKVTETETCLYFFSFVHRYSKLDTFNYNSDGKYNELFDLPYVENPDLGIPKFMMGLCKSMSKDTEGF